jgi:hypothetical protein
VTDIKTFENFIENQVNQVINQQVDLILNDADLLNMMEERITNHVKDRISAKFANVSAVPELIQAVQHSVANLMQQGMVPGIDAYVDKKLINKTIDNSIQHLVKNTIDSLILDQTWLDKMQVLVNQSFQQKFNDRLSLADFSTLIKDNIDSGIARWQDRLKENFVTHGIKDLATNNQITITDNGVVATNGIATPSLLVEKDAEVTGTLKVKDLAVTGSINTDNQSWQELVDKISKDALASVNKSWRDQLVSQIVDSVKKDGIDFASVSINGHALLDAGVLSAEVKHSSLTSLGTLNSLNVSGTLDAHGTLSVRQRRIGINTIDPEMALNVWDEEVSVLIGKLSADRAYFGTGRRQSLSLGVDRKAFLDIDADGLVSVKQLRIDKFKIGHTNSTPGWSGQRGDFLINHDWKPGEPFAWICLGAYKWQPLKSA